MKRKTFNQHLYERDVAWKKSASSLIFADNIESMKIPFSTPIYKRTFGKPPRTRVFHIVDPENFRKLIKLEGKKKSISALTYAEPFYVLNGINQSGGIAVEMEADVLVAQRMDIMSIPDKTGRRWVSFADLKGIIKDNYDDAGPLIRTLFKDIETLLAALVTKHMTNPALSKDDQLFLKKRIASRKYEDAWYYLNPAYTHLKRTNPGNIKKQKQLQQQLVKDYLDGMESVMKKNAKELGTAITGHLLKRETTAEWDELVVNKFKIKRVLIAKWSVLDYFDGPGREHIEFIKLVQKKYKIHIHDTADTISTYMKSVSQDLIA